MLQVQRPGVWLLVCSHTLFHLLTTCVACIFAITGAAAGRGAAHLSGRGLRLSGFPTLSVRASCSFLSSLQVQRPGVEPLIFRDIFLFRTLGTFVNAW